MPGSVSEKGVQGNGCKIKYMWRYSPFLERIFNLRFFFLIVFESLLTFGIKLWYRN